MAHDQRRGGVGLLRGRHRAVPHRRRHRATRSCQYVDATGDDEFLARDGVEILVETARLWADLGFWRSNGDARRSTSTASPGPTSTRPSSTTTCSPTSWRASTCAYAAPTRALAREHDPEAYAAAASQRLGLDDDEVDGVGSAPPRRCTSPTTSGLGIHPQDDALPRPRGVGPRATPPDEPRPLLLHYHPLVIYRFQVLKQADVVLALFLQGDEFTAEQKRRDFEYYDPLTTGDSTLSAVVQSIIAAEVGYHELALRVLPASRSSSTWPTCTATPPTACTSPRPAACGARWSTASAGCATTAAR